MGQKASVLPSAELTLSPTYATDSADNGSPAIPTGINIVMRLKVASGRFTTKTPFLTLLLKLATTETARYDGDAISASDAAGKKLALHYEDSDGTDTRRTWYLDEVPKGDEIVVEFLAPARKTDKDTLIGPRIDLRKDPGGGLVGQGAGFIPVVPDVNDGRKGKGMKPEQWKVVVKWHLEGAPEGTRGACSLGDGDASETERPLADAITKCIFAVGHLKRYPDWDSPVANVTSVDGKRPFSMYWLGDTIYDMEALPPVSSTIFQAIADFFSSPNAFRVFLREVESGHGGTGALDSFLLEYSEEARDEDSFDTTIDLLAHETIHEYALLEADEPAAGQQEVEGAWYVEGIANYYGAVASFQGGAITREQLLKALNNYAQSYYTNPVVDMSYEEVLRRYWESVYILRVSYNLGFIYIAAENARIAAATGGAKSFDDVALELYRRRLTNEPHRIEEYYALVGSIIGKEEEKANREAMMSGKLVVPPADCLANLGLKLVRRDAEKFELGFDPASLRENVIRGLVKGSNADKAGMRDGDKVVRSWMAWGAMDALDNVMRTTVLRDGREEVIEWWPRSAVKVECWAWVFVDEME